MKVFKTILDSICDFDPMPHASTQKNIMNAMCVVAEHYPCSGGTFDGCFVLSVLIELKGERLAFWNRNAVFVLTDAKA